MSRDPTLFDLGTYPLKIKQDRFGGFGHFATQNIEKGAIVLVEEPLVAAFPQSTKKVCKFCGKLNPNTHVGSCVPCLLDSPIAYDCLALEEKLAKEGQEGTIYNTILLRIVKMLKMVELDVNDPTYPQALNPSDVEEITKKTPTIFYHLSPEDSALMKRFVKKRLTAVNLIDVRNMDHLQSKKTFTSEECIKAIKVNEKVLPKATVEDLLRKINLNAITVKIDDEVNKTSSEGRMIFIASSYFNHECVPNCTLKVIEGKAFVVANRYIRKDEELTLTYIPEQGANDFLSQKQTETLGIYGFLCTCPICEKCVTKGCGSSLDKICSKCGVSKYCSKCNRSSRQWWLNHAVFCPKLVDCKKATNQVAVA